MHDPPKSMIIIECIMLSGAIIPKGQRTRFPMKSAAKVFSLLLLIEVFEDRVAFLNSHSLDMYGMCTAAVERFFASLWMRSD